MVTSRIPIDEGAVPAPATEIRGVDETHDGVRWDGQKAVGGAPSWLVAANQRGPRASNGATRVHDSVHLFDWQGRLKGVARPGDWIFRRRGDGALHVVTASEVEQQWTFVMGEGWRRRDRVSFGPDTRPRLAAALERVLRDRGQDAPTWPVTVPAAWYRLSGLAENTLRALSPEDEATVLGPNYLSLTARHPPLALLRHLVLGSVGEAGLDPAGLLERDMVAVVDRYVAARADLRKILLSPGILGGGKLLSVAREIAAALRLGDETQIVVGLRRWVDENAQRKKEGGE